VTSSPVPGAAGPVGSTAFARVASRTVYRGRSTIRIETIRDASGTTFEREIVAHADAVAMVAVDAEDRVALVRQYRHAVAGDLLEIPAGTLDVPGEAPEEAARRELAEEAGLASAHLVPLGRVWNSAGWCDEGTILFLATDLTAVPPPEGYAPRAEEAAMTVEWHPLDALHRAALDGTLTDAKTVIGVLRAVAVLRAGT
jgi:8-oxo-dGTP pyrophosphatase MutT (NUDIX family)